MWGSRRRRAVAFGATATASVGLGVHSAPAAPTPCGKLLPPTQGMYFGAGPGFSNEDAVTRRPIFAFDYAAQRSAVWTYFGQWWRPELTFPASDVRLVWKLGKVPFIRLNPFPRQPFPFVDPPGAYPGPYTLQDIAAGVYDPQLRAWAGAARDTRIPILLEFGTELNNYFPWSGRNNGAGTTNGYGDPAWPDGPERFRDAYRHLVTLFRQQGVTNVTWFFHADTAYYWAPESWNELKWYYPGNDYVDWLALSLYAAPIKPDGSVTSFDEKLQTFHQPGYVGTYDEITALGDKPLALTEVGFNKVPDLHLRSTWVKDAAASMKSGRFPRLGAFSWYEIDGGDFDGAVDASPEFQSAFRASFGDPFFGSQPRFGGNCLPTAPASARDRRGRVSWRAVPNAASYEVWQGKKRIAATEKTFVFVGKQANGLRVRALNMLGAGPFAVVR